LGLLGKEAYIYGGVLLERTRSIATAAKIGVDGFCKGVLLGNILLSEFWKMGGYRKFSFHFAQSLTKYERYRFGQSLPALR